MTPYLCGPTCGMSDAPLSSFSTEWVSDYVCVWVCVCACVSTTVLLVSSYRDGAMRRNGPLCCLAGRPDPSRSTSITTWNLNVKHGPPATAICLSLCVSRPGHSHTRANTLTCYYSIVLTCTNILRSEEMSPTATSSRFRMCLKGRIICNIYSRNSFPPASLKLSVLLTDWQSDWTQLLVNSCLYLAYLWVDWLTFGVDDGQKVSWWKSAYSWYGVLFNFKQCS